MKIANFKDKLNGFALTTCSILIATLMTVSAQAQMFEDGIYKISENNQGFRGKMAIKTVASRHALTTYAFVMLDSQSQAAVFIVEPVNGGLYSFTPLAVNEKNILSSGKLSQAAYSAQMVTDRNGKANIVLNPTPHVGGCWYNLRFERNKDSRYTWIDIRGFNASKLKINKDWKIDLAMTGTVGMLPEYNLGLFGGDDINGRYAGNYVVREQIPGLGLARRSDLDSTKASGTAMNRRVDFALVLLNSSSSKEKPMIHMVSLGKPSSCFSPTAVIK